MKKVNMFVSYCQKDAIYADNIDLYFKGKNIKIHRDIRDISDWKSIREYMQTIRDMDYAILIITDNYLKSFNCMYEVLEVMKEKNYENKIFPVVVETSIYSNEAKIDYVKFWENKCKELQEKVSEINVVNAVDIINDLKRTQNICSSIIDFLSKVSDMNNPNILNVNVAIENKLQAQGLLDSRSPITNSTSSENTDIFSSLNIPKTNTVCSPTDLDKNKFMTTSFNKINILLKELCNQLENDSNNIQVDIEQIDARTIVYSFYKNGQQVRILKLLLGNCLGMRETTIGLSSENYYFGNNNSFNQIISSKVYNGELALCLTMSMSGDTECKSVEVVVRDIWTNYVYPYLN
ncbi:hypothetical protein CLOHAE12215_01425 [Clostridium haemolyticum]|uniref:toll/interleukin-1 receptor domain-containing protein n=1 Tax=Clostridium haemolyticum TaxID=84025 RepID=UPI001C3BF936|nr:toll/interleukin-1 receptor domain-containing protein [Clostridium haemolyticum]CAG7840009.1 hypothetical protein CLOHAE12215_01425 [Clostridium haemolyticum]